MVHLSVVYGQSQPLGFGTSLNSIVATSTQHSFYLPIFQLPERTHCTASVFLDTSIWNFFPLAQTTMGLHAATSSSYLLQQTVLRLNCIVGGDSTFGLQFPQTFPDGETYQISRVRPSWMLLCSQARIQPERTTTVVCSQCYRQSHQILEGKTCPSLPTFTSSMVTVTYMVL